jgi:glutaredoxin
MKQLILYGTQGCHLCEQAAELLAYVLDETIFDIQEVDISESDDLLEKYGEKIPVLKQVENGAELCWPFDDESLEQFLI